MMPVGYSKLLLYTLFLVMVSWVCLRILIGKRTVPIILMKVLNKMKLNNQVNKLRALQIEMKINITLPKIMVKTRYAIRKACVRTSSKRLYGPKDVELCRFPDRLISLFCQSYAPAWQVVTFKLGSDVDKIRAISLYPTLHNILSESCGIHSYLTT